MSESRRVARYPRHEQFVAPARQRGEWWRLILGCAVLVLAHQMLLSGVVTLLKQRYGGVFTEALMSAISLGRTPGSLVILLCSFAILGASALIAVRVVHSRSPRTLLGPSTRSAIASFNHLAPILVAFSLALLLLTPRGPDVVPHQSFSTILAWLPLALPALFVQVLSEEVIFRGYLQQQLAAINTRALVWLLLPTLVFAAGHYDAAIYGPNAWLVCVWAAAFGAVTADLTARTGNLGAAVAVHFSTNVAAFFFIGYGGTLDGLTLWTSNADLSDPAVFRPLLLADLLTLLNIWLLTRLLLRV